MRYASVVEPQDGLNHLELRDLAGRAEGSCFEAFFRSRPLAPDCRPIREAGDGCLDDDRGSDLRYSPASIGNLVSPVTFRHPVVMARIVATADEMSGGRVELGVGAGWYQPALPFPRPRVRSLWLEEQVQIIKGLWTERVCSFEGRNLRIRRTSCEPKPIQRGGPLLILGGLGRSRVGAVSGQLRRRAQPRPSRARTLRAGVSPSNGSAIFSGEILARSSGPR